MLERTRKYSRILDAAVNNDGGRVAFAKMKEKQQPRLMISSDNMGADAQSHRQDEIAKWTGSWEATGRLL